jgi:hypothetical protein
VSKTRYELLPLATVQLPREFPWWGLLVCLVGKSPKEEGRTLWATTREEDYRE